MRTLKVPGSNVLNDRDQFIVTLKKSFKGTLIHTKRRWVKDIFTLNNIAGFSPQSCWAASTSKAKNMEVKNRKNLFIHYNKVITKYAPDDIDLIRICQV